MYTLSKLLSQIDGKSYKAYKRLKNCFQFEDFILSIDHVQGDPFALPSRISIRVKNSRAGFPWELWGTPDRRTACEDFIGRKVAQAITRHVNGRRGSGKSGQISIAPYGQQVLKRNSVQLSKEFLEVRMTLGLPAKLRTIDAGAAHAMLFNELPLVVHNSMLYTQYSSDTIKAHVESIEDQIYLRKWLDTEGLVAFIGQDSILPRRTGIDDRPLQDAFIKFSLVHSLAYSVDLPNIGIIQGMGIPKGVTLIVGGGFHGKSTVLHAVEKGVYNHIPDDGRACVVTDASAIKVRAEDARHISNVNISAFIDDLPLDRNTQCFSTDNASGSTSQAANIVEALETGSRLLLIDEDTSATNFMIRDERMQRLVAKDKEPITPFLHRVRDLYEQYDVSSIIVMGGSGDYFEVADTVIMMDSFKPKDVTKQARNLAGNTLADLKFDLQRKLELHSNRRPGKKTLDSSQGKHDIKIDTHKLEQIRYGVHNIDLTKVEQLVDIGQTKAIGWMMVYYLNHFVGNGDSMVNNLKRLCQRIENRGLDELTPFKMGELALPRIQELAATINRIRCNDWESGQSTSQQQK